jgi:hypothetical protein
VAVGPTALVGVGFAVEDIAFLIEVGHFVGRHGYAGGDSFVRTITFRCERPRSTLYISPCLDSILHT